MFSPQLNMKKLLITLFILSLSILPVFADQSDEQITTFDNSTIPVLNDALQSISRKITNLQDQANATPSYDGNYFTDLANIPSGAGVIPSANLPSTTGLGSWVDDSSSCTNVHAATDGFVICYNTGNSNMASYTDSSNPPTTQRGSSTYSGETYRIFTVSTITMPVKKGDYWTVTGASKVYWVSSGS